MKSTAWARSSDALHPLAACRSLIQRGPAHSRCPPAPCTTNRVVAPSSADAWIKWPWERGERSRAHRHGAQHRLDVSGSQMPTNVPRVPSRPAHTLPNGDVLSNYRRGRSW